MKKLSLAEAQIYTKEGAGCQWHQGGYDGSPMIIEFKNNYYLLEEGEEITDEVREYWRRRVEAEVREYYEVRSWA